MKTLEKRFCKDLFSATFIAKNETKDGGYYERKSTKCHCGESNGYYIYDSDYELKSIISICKVCYNENS